MSIGLRIGLTLIGFLFIILGIALNQIFYYSLAGDATLYQFAYSAIGIGLDVSKVLALMLAAALIATGIALMVIAGAIAFALYLFLASISLTAGWGFSLVVAENYETTKQQSSAQYQLAQSNLETAIATANNLAQYSTLNLANLESQAQVELSKSVQNSSGKNAGTLATRTTDCTNTTTYYYRYCDKYNQLQAQIEQAKQYQTALAAKQAAQTDMATIDSSGIATSVLHPVFIGMSKLGILGDTPEMAKYRFLFISFSLIEFIGAFFFALGVMFRQRASMTVNEMQTAMKNITSTVDAINRFQGQMPSPALSAAPKSPIHNPK